MPELNLGPAPTSSPTRAIVAAAAVLLLAAAGVYYYLSLQKAELTVTAAKPYAIHIENKGTKSTMHIIGAPPSIENDLYVVLTVKLTNKLHEPLFVKDYSFSLTTPDGSVADTNGLQKDELERAYAIFPDLKAMAGAPLLRDTKVEPGQSAEGTVVVTYPNATEKDWSSRKGAALTATFFHQGALTAKVP